MEKKDRILQEITGIFRKELNEPDLELTLASSANSVEKWDSINNLILLSAIEEKFNLEFPVEFILRAENVGDLCQYILENATLVD